LQFVQQKAIFMHLYGVYSLNQGTRGC